MSIGSSNSNVDLLSCVNSETSLDHMPNQNYSAFGMPTDLSELNLPTAGDVLRYYFLLSDRSKSQSKMFSYGHFTTEVADRLIGLWQKLNIVLNDKRSIVKKLNALINKYKKAIKDKPTSENYKAFLKTKNELFYIGKCKCDLQSRSCTCGLIPDRLNEFMHDQHTSRNLTIPECVAGSYDLQTVVTTQPPASEDPSFRPCPSDMDVDEEFHFQAPIPPHEHPPKRGPYTERFDALNFAMACDRFGISDRIASFLATALLKDFDLKDKMGNLIIMDKAKVARERKKYRALLRTQRHDNLDIIAFSFDGRKDVSLSRSEMGGKYHTRSTKESHIVVAKEPQAEFLGHITVNGETADIKHKKLSEFFQAKGFSLANLIGICSDGEPTNTGTENGILRRFEISLGRPLHWFVCLLHFNELPFRHFFAEVEKSMSTGPRSSTGKLAKLIETCEQQQVKLESC